MTLSRVVPRQSGRRRKSTAAASSRRVGWGGVGTLDWIREGRGEWAGGPTLGKKYLLLFKSPWSMAQFLLKVGFVWAPIL